MKLKTLHAAFSTAFIRGALNLAIDETRDVLFDMSLTITQKDSRLVALEKQWSVFIDQLVIDGKLKSTEGYKGLVLKATEKIVQNVVGLNEKESQK